MTPLTVLLTLILAASSPRPAHDLPARATSAGTAGAGPWADRGDRTLTAGIPARPFPLGGSARRATVPSHDLTRQGGPNPATAEPSPGIASWYPAMGPVAAAGPALQVGDWRGSTVTVCATANGISRCLAVTLTDWCQCYAGTDRERIIDLSDDAVTALGLRLSTGLYRVTIG